MRPPGKAGAPIFYDNMSKRTLGAPLHAPPLRIRTRIETRLTIQLSRELYCATPEIPRGEPRETICYLSPIFAHMISIFADNGRKFEKFRQRKSRNVETFEEMSGFRKVR
jgi:hypothetical protein